MTKLTPFTSTITLLLTINFIDNTFNNHDDLLKSCVPIKSNLPINHSNNHWYAIYI